MAEEELKPLILELNTRERQEALYSVVYNALVGIESAIEKNGSDGLEDEIKLLKPLFMELSESLGIEHSQF